MKKTIFLLIFCLSLTSCVLKKSQEPGRTASFIREMSCSFAQISVKKPAVVMDCCMLAHDYLNASEEERKDSKYSVLTYSATDKSFKTSSDYTIETYGRNFFTLSTEWTISRDKSKYVVKCTGDKQWTFFPKPLETDSFLKGLDFTSIFAFIGKDSDGLCIWQCQTNGSFKEGERYYATFQTDNNMTVKWIKQYSASSAIMSQQVISGIFAATYFIDGKKTDWCTLNYENGEVKKAVTSQD